MAYAFGAAESVAGIEAADSVAGALRTYEAHEETRWHSIIAELVRERIELDP
ncbi:MAG: hypothetical protein ACE5O2_00880 [Armatimonadota bacterium]